MEDVNFKCLCCEGCYHKKHHDCTDMCRPKKKGVSHFDFCFRCVRLLMGNFESQFARKLLAKPKLRLEENEDGA